MNATALAQELVAVHADARTVPPFSERYPGLTPAAGYDAARALDRHRRAQGWRPMGRKIGFTNRTLWARYGVHEPMWGTVYDRTLIEAEDGSAAVPLAGLVQPRIEPEIGFKLKSAPPAGRDPETLLGAIEFIFHTVEIVQCHHPDWKVTIADCCADNGLHGRLVVGKFFCIENFPDMVARLPAAQARLFKGETLVDQGVGANVLGSPLLALGFLLEALSKQGGAEPLAAGEIVTTGVLTDAHPVQAGEVWRTEISGLPLPGLKIEFT
jgi:2-oxo-3-hexenedioate decarboxylase